MFNEEEVVPGWFWQGDVNRMSRDDKYKQIVSHYEECFSRHGDTNQGVDWPNMDDLLRRYRVMLDVIRQRITWSAFSISVAALRC